MPKPMWIRRFFKSEWKVVEFRQDVSFQVSCLTPPLCSFALQVGSCHLTIIRVVFWTEVSSVTDGNCGGLETTATISLALATRRYFVDDLSSHPLHLTQTSLLPCIYHLYLFRHPHVVPSLTQLPTVTLNNHLIINPRISLELTSSFLIFSRLISIPFFRPDRRNLWRRRSARPRPFE